VAGGYQEDQFADSFPWSHIYPFENAPGNGGLRQFLGP
jgi:hypothetical protein